MLFIRYIILFTVFATSSKDDDCMDISCKQDYLDGKQSGYKPGKKRPMYGLDLHHKGRRRVCCTLCTATFRCNDVSWTEELQQRLEPNLMEIHMDDMKEISFYPGDNHLNISGQTSLENASFTDCEIDVIPPYTFQYQTKLIELSLAENNIISLHRHVFYGLEKLKILDLKNNGLYHLWNNAFEDIKSSLTTLDLRNNRLSQFNENDFHGWNKELKLYTDAPLFCCIVGEIGHCEPLDDKLSSCSKNLIENETLRILMWIIGIGSLISNLSVILWRLRENGTYTQSIIVTNLATSDLLMGVYVMIIAGADMHYGQRYLYLSRDWKNSFRCSFAGAIFTFSSEFSIIVLTLMSVDSYITAIVYPSSRLNRSECKRTLKIAFLVFMIISFLPMLNRVSFINMTYFGDNYYGQYAMCSPLPLTGETSLPGWEYATAIFYAFNLYCFIIITGFLSFSIYTYVNTPFDGENKEQLDQISLVMEITPIILVNACCWVPVISLGIVSQAGLWDTIPPDVYLWSTAFIIPIKSIINPFCCISYMYQAEKSKPPEEIRESPLFDSDIFGDRKVTQV